MNKLKKLLNPLDIPYATQSELFRVTEGNCLLMLGEPDFLNALTLEGEMHSLRFAPYELGSQQSLDDNLKNEIIHAKAIFIVIETLQDESIKKYSHIMDYISSVVDDDVTVLFDSKVVAKILYEPITILLFGYENDEKFLLEVGSDFADFWQENNDYCVDEFKQMRERVSKQVKETITPLRLTSSSRSSNMIELVDVQNYQALRVFEFNEQTKDEFVKFRENLENILFNFYYKE